MHPLKVISSFLFLLVFMIVLTGCSLFTKTIYVEKPVPYLREPLGCIIPDGLILDEVSVILVTPKDAEPYFVISPESYEAVLINNKQIEMYIREATAMIEECEAYYTAPISSE